MAELLVFHHAQGLTSGMRAFEERMSGAGHTAYLPDLYDGRTFDSLEEGVAHADEVGFDTIIERGRAAAEGLPDALAYIGFSLGVMDRDPLASPPETDLETARRLDAELEEATFFSYPGDAHLFADESLPSYDAGAAQQAEARVLDLLAGLG